ncbi:beta-ketoacyl-ACP synthase II [Acanthopleuribacter pedis]|uniref:3-oxoacyl-[acyl-carrier-protein] synthase 2 n=1 Tax=Acanthopleuribacter pedis TaxID=442870 RepID=A0A8J7QH92_9BACT|nr:beta-ketoacyl-ACP synthase II [Acanthopleuribacter pedis]MBO1320381.1 beta-ketoacyl-ACP synthase II [Acanthopleuribacter pedis]
MRRVVITGLGAISPLGHDVETTFAHLLQGQSGIVQISKFDAANFPSRIAGEVRDLDISPFFSKKEAKKVDDFIQLAVIAAHEAFADSGLDLEKVDLERFGTIIGSGIGGLPMIERQYKVLLEKGPRRVTPFFIPSLIINLAGGQVSMKYGLKGPSSAPATACATGTHAIGDAFRLIQFGHADLMVAGGTESVVCELTMAGFGAMKALSTRNDEPHLASRPFDTARDGFVLGEGCGLLILEEYEHAVKRGAKIYAEITGYGMSSDAYHITSPSEDGDGPVRAMQAALKDARINPEQIDLINAHGTSTPAGDAIEALAIARVMGDHVGNVVVHSSKSMIGHMLGAAGGIEAVIVAKTIETGKVHPTANLENVDESVHFDPMQGDARDMSVNIGLSNSFGFGGTNGTLIFRKV